MIKAVIQAGGRGTRISSLTNDVIPKPMLQIDGKPILYHQIMNLKEAGIKDVIIIVGYLGDVIRNYFDNNKLTGINIRFVDENPDRPLGTAGALYYLKNKIYDDFIFLLGDVFISININKMINYHRRHMGDITLFTHPNSHPYDSDLVVVDNNDKVICFDYKTNDRSNYLYYNLVNAGVMIFRKNTLEYVKDEDKYSYEKDIIDPLIKKGRVYSYKSSEYAKDIGTPERFERVKNDYYNGLIRARNMVNKQVAMFIDIDSIINNNFEKDKSLINLIKLINNSKYLCIGISNSCTDLDYYKKISTVLGNNSAFMDDIIFDDRWNNDELMRIAANRYNIDISKSLFIDDMLFTKSNRELIKKLMI